MGRSDTTTCYFFQLLFLVIFFYSSPIRSGGISGNQNGELRNHSWEVPKLPVEPIVFTTGYDIVVGIDENSKEPANVGEYMTNLWVTLDTFSKEMFRVTKKHFYLRSASIVIPSTWNLETEVTVDSFQTAHIRISSTIDIPRAENPNLCGLPGNYIELPLDIFEKSDQFETLWKPLLHLWGRYRWGIWEEHGYVYSKRFPYSHLNETDWQPTGCSNEPIVGTYQNVKTGIKCENNGEYPPNVDCRFVVDEMATTATSSLMHLHSLPSIDDFCNETTHNNEPPNKQNIFCKHQSAWEIIQSSPEFNSGKEELDNPPDLPRLVLKTVTKPLFYFLLDNGRYTIPESAMATIRAGLVKFFREHIGNDTVGSIGTFDTDKISGLPVLYDTVPWTPLSSGRNDFITAINKYKPTSTNRNFGVALESVSQKLKLLNHTPGYVVLILKTGASSVFDKIPYEDEVLATFLEQRAKVFAIELPSSSLRANINLRTFTKSIGGHLGITDLVSLKGTERFLEGIGHRLNTTIWTTFHRHIFSGPVGTNLNTIHPMHHAGVTRLFFSLAVPNTLVPNSVRIIGNRDELTTKIRYDWDEMASSTRRTIYYGNLDVEGSLLEEYTEFQLEFNCDSSVDPSKCIGFFAIYGEVSVEDEAPGDFLDVRVSTSAHNNIIDLNAEVISSCPFAVFAKIEDKEKHRPVRNIDRVVARMMCNEDNEFFNFDLTDDGEGSIPDVFQGDGIYSGQFISPIDGSCKISLEITHDAKRRISSRLSQKTPKIKSLATHRTNTEIHDLSPSNQDFICEIGECNYVNPRAKYQQMEYFSHRLTVTNSNYWKMKFLPARIVTLTARAIDDYKVSITWTSPVIINSLNSQADQYILHIGTSMKDFDDETYKSLPLDIGGPPGTLLDYEFQGKSGEKHYFGLTSKFRSFESSMSNIVGDKTREIGLITTPMPSPPVPSTSPPESSTGLTSDDGSTPTEGIDSTTPTAHLEEDIEYWYETQEGYITILVFLLSLILIMIGAFVAMRWYRPTRHLLNKQHDQH